MLTRLSMLTMLSTRTHSSAVAGVVAVPTKDCKRWVSCLCWFRRTQCVCCCFMKPMLWKFLRTRLTRDAPRTHKCKSLRTCACKTGAMLGCPIWMYEDCDELETLTREERERCAQMHTQPEPERVRLVNDLQAYAT